MNHGHACSALFALTLMAGTAVAHPASTLSYTSPQTGSPRHLSLRRSGAWLQIVDDDSRAIVASARAAQTQRVAIRGADGDDDALTIDLTQRLALPGGIDYDGGRGGWDTLIVSGGRAEREAITQLTPHDGTVDVDGLMIRYVNLEPVVDTVPAASYTINGTAGADTVTISDGPATGQATISSLTFESVTFANKTNVIFDGMGGGDSVTFDNPNPPDGLQSLIVQNVATVAQTTAEHYPALGIVASGAVTLMDTGNRTANIGIQTQAGDIKYGAGANDMTIGGSAVAAAGMRTMVSGNIQVVTTGGSIILGDVAQSEIVNAAGTIILASGGDVVATVGKPALTATGTIQLSAERDVRLGDSGRNDVHSEVAVRLAAGRDVLLDGKTQILGDGSNTTAVYVDALRDVTVNDAMLLARGINPSIEIDSNGTIGLNGGEPYAVNSFGGVLFDTDHLVIAAGSGVAAPSGVAIYTHSVGFNIGDSADSAGAMGFSNAEAARIDSSFGVIFVATFGHGVTVTQPISVPYGLAFFSDTSFSATGAGALDAPRVEFGAMDGNAHTWDIDDTGITISPGTRIPYSGVDQLTIFGSDGPEVFNVTPSPTMVIYLSGDFPDPPATPGDELYVNRSGTVGAALSSTFNAHGYSGDYTFDNRALVHFDYIETLGTSTDLAVTLDDGVTTPHPGTNLAYTLVASNNGPLGIAGAIVADTFPPALTSVSWTCTATAGSSCNASGTGNLNEAVDLSTGGAATFVVSATLDPAATGSVTDTATIAPPVSIADPNPANDSASDTDVILVQADISVTKTAAQSTYTPGGTIAYAIALANAGPDAATNVVLTDVLPANTTFASLAAPAGFACTTPAVGAGGTISCTANSVAVSTNAFTLTVDVVPTATGPIVNSATVTSASTDPNSANNSASASVAAATADLSVTKVSTQSSYTPAGTIAYTLTLVNAGPDAASNVTLIDTLPPGTTFASLAAPAGFACGTPAVGSNGTISCTASSVAVSTNTFALMVNVAATASGPIVNSATVSGTSSDPNGANNVSVVSVAAAAAVAVVATPMLSCAMLLLLLVAFALIARMHVRHLR